MWPREEGSPENQGSYIDRYEYALFLATSGFQGKTDMLRKIRQFKWGKNKEVLGNQTTAFTEYSVFNHPSSRIRSSAIECKMN